MKRWSPIKMIVLKENYALVPLTKGKFAMIDREDVKAVQAYNWFYAMDHARSVIKGKNVRLHNFLMGKRKRQHINFKNGNHLDFRRKNMERVTVKFIHQKKGKISTPTTSEYKGVSWHTASERWEANIKKSQVRKHLGTFEKENDAAYAYNAAAPEYFGPHAFLNTI